MFSHLPKDEQRTRVMSLLRSLTGTPATAADGKSVWTNERLDKLLDAMERFQNFVESGGSFQPVSTTAVPHAFAFESFVFDRGGTLLTNELWAVLLFLSWWEQQQTLFSREETILLSTLKQEAQRSSSPFKPSELFTESYKKLLALWRSSSPKS